MKNTTNTLPPLFLERLASIIPSQHYDEVENSFFLHRRAAFRINTLKAFPQDVLASPELASIKPEPLKWRPNAFTVPHQQKIILSKSTLFSDGMIYIQNPSSMLPPIVLDPQPGDEILDLTAAPGSKTCQIAEMMQDQGRIAAVEKSKPRFFKLLDNLKRQGVSCVVTYLKDGTLVGRQCPERFDRVLLDAPCSSEARFHCDNPDSFHYWNTNKIKEMARWQYKLLVSAFLALKKGGTLVYSTCSFAPEENETIVNKLLRKFPGEITILEITLPINNIQPGLRQWKNKSFPEEMTKCVRVLPNEIMTGFFICHLKKH
jgi:NOL1/NOP2/sun family putative RNA methylase